MTDAVDPAHKRQAKLRGLTKLDWAVAVALVVLWSCALVVFAVTLTYLTTDQGGC